MNNTYIHKFLKTVNIFFLSKKNASLYCSSDLQLRSEGMIACVSLFEECKHQLFTIKCSGFRQDSLFKLSKHAHCVWNPRNLPCLPGM